MVRLTWWFVIVLLFVPVVVCFDVLLRGVVLAKVM